MANEGDHRSSPLVWLGSAGLDRVPGRLVAWRYLRPRDSRFAAALSTLHPPRRSHGQEYPDTGFAAGFVRADQIRERANLEATRHAPAAGVLSVISDFD